MLPGTTDVSHFYDAGRAVLILTAIIALLIAWIVLARWLSGRSISGLSLALPLFGLSWLVPVGLKSR